eukprot:1195085-Prorocentrum_minimum.AAC.2
MLLLHFKGPPVPITARMHSTPRDPRLFLTRCGGLPARSLPRVAYPTAGVHLQDLRRLRVPAGVGGCPLRDVLLFRHGHATRRRRGRGGAHEHAVAAPAVTNLVHNSANSGST